MTTCQNPSTGARTRHFYIEEVTCGVTPTSPAWKPLRYTSGNMQLSKDGLQSAELDGSREVADLRLGQNQTSGEISVELSLNAYDDLLEAALGGTWASGVELSGVEITSDATLQSFTRTAGDFLIDGAQVGMLVQCVDLVNGENNGIFQIQQLNGTTLYVCCINGVTVTDEVATTTDINFADQLQIGSNRRSFSVLTHFADADGGAGEYHLTKGVEIVGYSFDTSVNALVTGTFSTIGRSYSADVALPSGSTFVSVAKTEPFSSVDGTIQWNSGVVREPLAYVTSLTNTLDNNASAQFEIGSNDTSFIEQGRANSNISMTAFFEDSTILNRFINEEETSIQLTLSGTDGAFSFEYPRVIFTSGAPDVAGEGSITQSLDAQALLESDVFNSSLIVQRLERA